MKLYVVGTPIGNLGDLSPRAREVLSTVDFIAAEDTRVTLKLLTHFDIKKPMISYYEHNLRERGEYVLGRIVAGESCAVVSDAGMPCISDPGEDLVRLCRNREIPVEVVPGPSAAISALAVSGLITSRFSFEGFLSTAKKARAEHLDEVKDNPRTLIFYEAPHKLRATLADMLRVFGDRQISLARELTKIHEEVRRTTLGEAVEYYAANAPRGEFVLLITGAAPKVVERLTLEQAVAIAKDYAREGLSLSEAAKRAASETGYRKSELYTAVIADKD